MTATSYKPRTSRMTAASSKPGTTRMTATSYKPRTSRMTATSSKPGTSRMTATSSKPGTSRMTATSSKPRTSKITATSSKPRTSRMSVLNKPQLRLSKIDRIPTEEEEVASLRRQLQISEGKNEELRKTITILTKEFNPTKESTSITDVKRAKWVVSAKKQEEHVTLPMEKMEIDSAPPATLDSESKKWHVIFTGPFKGIYEDWHIVAQHIKGKDIIHQSFKTKIEAMKAYKQYWKKVAETEVPKTAAMESIRKIVRIVDIPTTAQSEQAKKITLEKFNHYWGILTDYQDLHTTMGFYPKLKKSGPKAVVVPGADPRTIYELFQCGLIDSIYSSTPRDFAEFPAKIKVVTRRFHELFAKDREVFLKCTSSIPIFGEDSEIVIPSITIARIGISGKDYPTRDEIKGYSIPENMEAIGLAETFRQSQTIKPESKTKINFANEYTLIYSWSSKPLPEDEMKTVVNFEESFYSFDGKLEKLSIDIKEQLCKLIRHKDDHLCEICLDVPTDGPQTKDFPALSVGK